MGLGFVVLAISFLPYYFLTLLWFKIDSFWLTSLVIENYRAVRLIHPYFYLFSAQAARYLIPQVASWLQETPQTVLAAYTLLAITMFSRLLFGLSCAAIIFWEGWRLRPQWRQVMSIGLICLFLISAGGLVFFPSVKKGVGTFVVQDLGLEKSHLIYMPMRNSIPGREPKRLKIRLFFYGSPLFRYRTQRSITHALDLMSHREARYVEIYKRYNRLEKAYEDPARLLQEAKSFTGKLSGG